MQFANLVFRDPITTLGGLPVSTNNPRMVNTQATPVQTAVAGIQVVHAVPVLLPVSTNQQLYDLPVANNAYLTLRENPKRRGLTIINTNPVANLYISFGSNFPINKCIPLAPGGSDVMDTAATPQDQVWITSDTTNSVVLLVEFQNN